MHRFTWGLSLSFAALVACAGGEDEPVDTDVDDTDAVVDTDVVDTDVADTGDTAADTVVIDTDVVDTDGEHVVVHGRLRCAVDMGTPKPATPGFAKITIVQPWTCPPLSGCWENENVEVLAEATVDKDGAFTLDFQTGSYRVDELYLYTNNDIGVCGNGYQFTQERLDSYADWDDVVIDVYSIFY